MTKDNFIKRDISWLSFNERVLQEAADPNVPLYERIKFLAIFSANLDEFYRVRVSALRSFKKLKKKEQKALIAINPKKELKSIQKVTALQQEQFGQIFRQNIIPELRQHGIALLRSEHFNENQRAFAQKYFQEHLKTKTEPCFISGLDIDNKKDLPFLENQGLYFVVVMQEEEDAQPLGLVHIPSDEVARFVEIPEATDMKCITFIDEIIRDNVQTLFPNNKVTGVYAIKISRDAELYITDEYDGDLIKKIRDSLSKRETGLPTRFLFDGALPVNILNRLMKIFKLSQYDLIPGGRYHNFNDFFGFPDPIDNPALHNEDFPPLPHPAFDQHDSMLTAMAERDQMLHFPYQSYSYVPKMIMDAADDESVKAVYITLYRVANRSAVTTALLRALEKGKEVTVFVEVKARFDEASNLYWGGKLEKAGAKVTYSYPGIKVHTKLLLIETHAPNDIRYFTYLGTGNFNEKTARIYGDHALFTSDQRLGGEVNQIFSILTNKLIVPKNKHLFIAPFDLRDKFTELIDKEIELAKAGKEAYMILKMNSLEDWGMIEKIHEAGKAGVKIQLIIRGMCCMTSNIEEVNKNIEIISIIDRFLEHARVYIFGNDGDEIMYTASADWMTRNLDRRIEVAIPIYDKEVYQELRQIIDIQLADNVKARIIDAGQSNPYRKLPGKSIRAQQEIYYLLKEKVG